MLVGRLGRGTGCSEALVRRLGRGTGCIEAKVLLRLLVRGKGDAGCGVAVALLGFVGEAVGVVDVVLGWGWSWWFIFVGSSVAFVEEVYGQRAHIKVFVG